MVAHKVPLRDRFWSKVEKRSPHECWPWTGVKTIYGYGQIRTGHKPARYQTAHRVCYAVHNNVELTSSDVIRHTCDNRICVNPMHLLIGTQADNMKDMDDRGRRRPGINKGVTNGRSVLTEEAVRKIRQSEANDTQTAKVYGVTKAMIGRIRARKAWSHVT
jgi:hypothetical protein